MSLEDVAFQLMEEYRIDQLKKLKKRKIDYDQLLKTIPIEEIERYLRKIKLEILKTAFYNLKYFCIFVKN